MKTVSQHPRLSWVVFAGPGQEPMFHEESFPGTLEAAAAELQSRANRAELFFGQVLELDGKVFRNIAPQVTA